MKTQYMLLWGIALAAACSTPGPVTGRPDPNVSTSGTIGSVKATDGVLPLTGTGIPRDTAHGKRDTIYNKHDTTHDKRG